MGSDDIVRQCGRSVVCGRRKKCFFRGTGRLFSWNRISAGGDKPCLRADNGERTVCGVSQP